MIPKSVAARQTLLGAGGEARSPEIKNSLVEIAPRWAALATDLDATHKLLKALEDATDNKKTG